MKNKEKYYNFEFYSPAIESTKRSAEKIVPLIIELINPKSVIDVGCGLGVWLSVFKSRGIEKILGLDCNKIKQSKLFIPRSRIICCDFLKPFPVNGTFDLALCLEVAEHLPSSYATFFIDSLIRLSPVVLFSAAIPFQGGVFHINEQWQDYWINLFEKKNYIVIDCIRNVVWNCSDVEYWYKQNMFIFVNKDYIDNYPKLKAKIDEKIPYSIVHPQMYLKTVFFKNASAKHIIRHGTKQLIKRIKEKIIALLNPKRIFL